MEITAQAQEHLKKPFSVVSTNKSETMQRKMLLPDHHRSSFKMDGGEVETVLRPDELKCSQAC